MCTCPITSQGYGNKRFVFQGVHETICYGPSERPWADSEPMLNQMVFIGRNLDRKALIEGFRWVDALVVDDGMCVVRQAGVFGRFVCAVCC